MKRLLLSIAAGVIVSTAMADIQDPPMNDQGPTRKLGRAMANLTCGLSEIPDSVYRINELEGNAAGATYGLVRGVGRFLFRIRVGLHEFATWPFPSYKRSFRPMYKSNIPWVNGGYEEFPPELGWQSRKPYCTTTATL